MQEEESETDVMLGEEYDGNENGDGDKTPEAVAVDIDAGSASH